MIQMSGGDEMAYTVKELSDLAGVSARTLRYYDKMDLLKPEKINASGYRIYGPEQVDLLQQILFYRELGFSLKTIRQILTAPDFDIERALTGQANRLLAERKRLDRLIATVRKTLASRKGETDMTDQEKFEGFKNNLIQKNEDQYGKEIREKYGEKAVDDSYKKFGNLTKEEYEDSEKTQDEMFAELQKGMEAGDPASEPAQKAAALHKKWLSYFWGFYTPEAHAGLVQMYVDDPRFTAYYDDRGGKKTAIFLRDAVRIFTGFADK